MLENWIYFEISPAFSLLDLEGSPKVGWHRAFCWETVNAPRSHLNADACLLEMISLHLKTSARNMGTRNQGNHGNRVRLGIRPIGASALIGVIIDALITKAGSLLVPRMILE